MRRIAVIRRARNIGQHIPIEIFDRTIEIDHRPWRLRDDEWRPRFHGNGFGQAIDQAVFETQQRMIGHAQSRQHGRRITPPTMRRGQHHRDRCGV